MGSPTSDNSFAVTESMDMDDCGVSGCYVERSNHDGCSLKFSFCNIHSTFSKNFYNI